MLEVYDVDPDNSTTIEGSLPYGAYGVMWSYQGKKGKGYVIQRKSITSDRYLQSYYLIVSKRYAIQDRETGTVFEEGNNKTELTKALRRMKRKGYKVELVTNF